MSRIERILAFAFAAALVSGCGQTAPMSATDDASSTAPASGLSASGTPATLPRACTLVTEAEAQAVVGQPVGLMADEPENCMWASAGHPGRMTMFMVQIVRGDDDASTRALYESLTGLSGDLNAMVNDKLGAKTQASGAAVADLGDAAWRSDSNADLVGTRQLVVRKGLVVLVLNITGMNRDGTGDGFDARMETAGRAALARMGG